MQDLFVISVGRERFAQVYPLVRSATRVSLERWEEFASALLSNGGGVLAVIAPDDCIHGIAAYAPRDNLRHERSLEVEVIVAFELRGDDCVRQALCHELERIAGEMHCAALNVTVGAKGVDAESGVRSGLERLGLKLDTAGFFRALPG